MSLRATGEFPAALRHMRADRGNASPDTASPLARRLCVLLTMAKTLARCSCRRDYDGSLHAHAAPTSPT